MSATDADRYPFGYDAAELERLGNQHRAWSEENQRLLRRAGFGDSDTLVDLGCGPGFTSMDLARRVGPNGRVIAVDWDGERAIAQLRRQTDAAGLENVDARVADLARFDLTAESVDGVYGRWVLMYLRGDEVEALIARIAKWLRPGARCALAEFCNFRHIHVHPPIPYLAAVAEALMQAAAGERGGNPEIGGALPGLLDRVGLDVTLNVVTKAIRPGTPEWGWPDALFRQLLPNLVIKDYVSAEIVNGFLSAWDERSEDPSTVFFSSPVMEVVAERPRG